MYVVRISHNFSMLSDAVCERPDLYPLMVPQNIGLGDPIDIFCTLRKGSLPVSFTWFLNGQILTDTTNIKITHGPRKSDCSVERLVPENIGNYTCQAKNQYGADNTSVLVYAEGDDSYILNFLIPF